MPKAAPPRDTVKPDARLSDADWKVMDVLWRHERATAREVHDLLAAETAWAYTTVKTMLDRLAEKGLVRKRSAEPNASGSAFGNSPTAGDERATPPGDAPRRAGHYEALVTRSQARLQAARALAERAFGGALAPLVHFLLESEPLSEADRADLLEKLERENERISASVSKAKPRAKDDTP